MLGYFGMSRNHQIHPEFFSIAGLAPPVSAPVLEGSFALRFPDAGRSGDKKGSR
jgi:hypothetical protein